LAAYDPNSTNVNGGGYGYAATSGDLVNSSYSWTTADAGHPILLDGILTEIKIRFHNGGSDCTMAKLKVLRGNGPNYSVVSTTDITSALNAARLAGDRFLFDLTGLNIAIQAGDIIGFYITPDEGSINYVFKQSTGTDCVYGNGDVSNLPNIYSGRAFYMDAIVRTPEYVIYDNTNGEAGLTTANSPIFIPYFTDKNQYIILEGIDGINNYESLSVGLDVTASTTGESSTLESIVIYMAPNLKGYISMTTCNKKRSLTVDTPGNKFDIYIWTDKNTQQIEVLYVDRDLVVPLYYSLTSRSPQYLAGCNTIRRLILSQGAGNSARIDRIVVCRQPVLAVGDSFVSGSITATQVLNHVGAKLDDPGVFTNRRYCINGGLSGNTMCYETTNTIPGRWDGSGNMCAFRDVLVAFVNGPGLNDIASHVYTLALQREYTAGLIGALATMARKAMDDADTYGGTNDVVFCQMIPYMNPTNANAYNAQAIIDYNKEINKLGYYTNSPVASMADFPLNYISADGAHPTDDGDLWIASQIAMAYEHNTVPGTSPCQYSLAGDLNDDCKVDLYDFAQMASNWLINCSADPNDPECYTK
jgi:hypothetical protein